MISIAKHMGKLIMFWMLIFFVNRIVFYFITLHLIPDVSFGLIVQSFFQGFYIDISTAAYVTAPIAILSLIAYLFQAYFLNRINHIVTYIGLIFYNLSSVGEGVLYREWSSKLSSKALSHFANPSEVFSTASIGLTITFFSVSIILSILYIWLYRKFIKDDNYFISNTKVKKRVGIFIPSFILTFGIWLIMIRGGFGIPIQSSDAYYCNEPMMNDVAVNPAWNIGFEMLAFTSNEQSNLFNLIDDKTAQKRLSELYFIEKDSTELILSNTRPNIVFLILESWSAECIKSFRGDDFAPFIDSLSREGVRFTNTYAAGHVSDQGVPAILSGQPCVSRFSVVNQTSKSKDIPCLNESLKPLGYSSAFFFGGDLNYGNIRGYLFNKKWDRLVEERDIKASYNKGKLGIQDGDMAQEYLNALNEAKQPFIYSWFTLSSHMPYDFPGEIKPITDQENAYINSVTYSDSALKSFFEQAKSQDWYKNTLFVICADHSHRSHVYSNNYQAEYHRIPMLFFGDVIKPENKGKVIERTHSQIDIAKSILYQMGLKEEGNKYKWSRDLFNPYSNDFAYFCCHGGAGMINQNCSVSIQHGSKRVVYNNCENKADSMLLSAKAFQQMVFDDYLNLGN